MINDHKIYIVAAIDKNRGIGKDNKLPWRLSKEIKYFKKLTTKTEDDSKQNMVIMGRTTWESLPKSFRPLPKRRNVVLSRNPDYKLEEADVVDSLDKALELAGPDIEDIFIIGGSSTYHQAVEHPQVDGIYLTEIQRSYDCDSFFPEIPAHYEDAMHLGKDSEDGVDFEYLLYA